MFALCWLESNSCKATHQQKTTQTLFLDIFYTDKTKFEVLTPRVGEQCGHEGAKEDFVLTCFTLNVLTQEHIK
ncbi:hypothetical protein BLNAU_25154 [Blattamonas nauphoetae]|uniref:Secreted protein n=1 Tax=Blattamonas nauphoetae TaxID=2049346 RepID=A0ABQ9WKD1_9EUKA|nr:hypothetical protein BLNAU_25154 [Blattamonas nauphoetae]